MNSIPHVLSLLIFLPTIAAILVGLMPENAVKAVRYVSLGATVVNFALSLFIFKQFNGASFHFQLNEFAAWMPRVGINYSLGIDGVSIWLVILTTFLSVIATWFSFYVQKRVKAYMASMLILQTAMLGVFCSLDMIVFYTFFEASLVPMWLLISIWGGERRIYSGFKFFIYTFAGSIFMLVGMIALAWLNKEATGAWSFSIVDIQQSVASGALWAKGAPYESLIFWSFAIAFLVKCPAFPFHTWLPDAHVEAPTAGSVILAGVLLKMGTYGFLRFVLPFFPDVLPQMAPYLCALAIIGIIYGAVVAAIQPDVKKLVAYSSVAHMGFVLIGIFSLTNDGIVGGALQQLNHGISTGALFLLIGLIYERKHTRLFKDYGGLKAQMPIFAAIFLIVMLSSVGLPGTNGFVGEFLSMYGFFQAAYNNMFGLNVVFAAIAGTGVILAAVYLLWMFQKVFYGPNDNPENQRLKDLKPWEIAMAGSLVVLIFWGGIYPKTFTEPMEASLNATRMMALNGVGARPIWANPGHEIDNKGNLVLNEPPPAGSRPGTLPKLTILAPANFFFGVPQPKTEAKVEE